MDAKLTNDADALICLLYKNYLLLRKQGTPKSNAKCLGSSKQIHKTITPKWTYEDVDETCRELSRANLLKCSYADNVVYIARLTDEGIVYMENRFMDGVDGILDYLSKLRVFIPFI